MLLMYMYAQVNDMVIRERPAKQLFRQCVPSKHESKPSLGASVLYREIDNDLAC
jgi:hypothetical protein